MSGLEQVDVDEPNSSFDRPGKQWKSPPTVYISFLPTMYIYFIYLVIELERLTHKQPNSQKHLIGEGKMTISSKSEDVDSLKHTILK